MPRITKGGEFEWTCSECGKLIRTDKLGPEFEIACINGMYVPVLAVNVADSTDDEHVHGFAFALTHDRALELSAQLFEAIMLCELTNARQARSN